MINQVKKIDEIEVIQENASKIVQCDTCAILKIHRLIQRTSSTKAIKIFQILSELYTLRITKVNLIEKDVASTHTHKSSCMIVLLSFLFKSIFFSHKHH
jgi:hypothetical protein